MNDREFRCWRCERVVARGWLSSGTISVTCKRCGAIVVCHGELDSVENRVPSYVSTT